MTERKPAQEWPVVLVECGSFNPPTTMHLRALELARQELFFRGIDVLGAYISPVNDAYWKPSLISGLHRLQMCELAVKNSDFIMVDPWEVRQKQYTRTLHVLESIQSRLHVTLAPHAAPETAIPTKDEITGNSPLIPREADRPLPGSKLGMNRPRTMLVCGADVLQSMMNESIWKQDLLEILLRDHGVVCISREGAGIDVNNVVAKAPDDSLLHRYAYNIIIIKDPIPNEVSSSLVRHELEKGHSVMHLVPESVISYIYQHGLYNTVPGYDGPQILKFLAPKEDKDVD